MSLNRIFVCLYLFILSSPLFTESLRLEPDPFYIDAASWEEPLSLDKFIILSFYASGLSVEQSSVYRDALYQDLSRLEPMVNKFSTDYEKGEFLLEYIHENYLKEYVFTQTRLDVLWDTGKYNCVSSGVFYMIFARYFGLDVGAIYAVDHAFCYINTVNGPVDIETTNPYGFDPGQKKEFTDSFTGKTGFSYVPPKDYKLRSPINDKEMVGLILQNRIASLQRQNDSFLPLSLSIDRWTLTQSPKGYADFLIAVRNLGVYYNDSRQYGTGLEILNQINLEYPIKDVKELKDVFLALGRNGLLVFLNKNDLSSAEAYLVKIEHYGFYTEKELNDFNNLYNNKRIEILVTEEDYETALPEVNHSYQDNLIDYNTWKTAIVYLITKKSETLSETSGYLQAYLFISNLESDYTSLKEIDNLKNIYLHNYAVIIHNEFVPLYNNQQYEEAANVLLKGLKYAPDESLLTKDKSLLAKLGYSF